LALYLISYDINEKDAFEYEGLWKHLKAIGAAKILYSEWVVEGSTGTATAIYSDIAPLTQGKDRLLVQEIAKDAYWDKLLVKDEKFSEILEFARK